MILLLVACETAAVPTPVVVEDPPETVVPKAPARDWNGLVLGETQHEGVEAWIAEHRLECTALPAQTRSTFHYRCEDPVGLRVSAARQGVATQLLIARAENAPVHHVSTIRKYSDPAAAAEDYDLVVAELGARFGTPKRSQEVKDLAAFSRPLARFATSWAYDDLDVTVSLMKASGPNISLTEAWTVPGVEQLTTSRTRVTSRPPGWNPHVADSMTPPGTAGASHP